MATIAGVPPQLRVGIDIGGVLNKANGDMPQWHLTQRAMNALSQMLQQFGANSVFIVSKCSGVMRDNCKTWLFETMDICGSAGMLCHNVHFCHKRWGPQGKSRIAGALGITHFIYDRDDCLCLVYQDPADTAGKSIWRHKGTLIHFSKGARGKLPLPKDWWDRPPGLVVRVGTLEEALQVLGVGDTAAAWPQSQAVVEDCEDGAAVAGRRGWGWERLQSGHGHGRLRSRSPRP